MVLLDHLGNKIQETVIVRPCDKTKSLEYMITYIQSVVHQNTNLCWLIYTSPMLPKQIQKTLLYVHDPVKKDWVFVDHAGNTWEVV